MPMVDFDTLPPAARVWVFGAAAPVVGAACEQLLDTVDAHLAQWRAHGIPLVCAREWVNDRFLAIAVDEAATGASGCSIDGMFRVLASFESQLGTTITGGNNVFWRDASGDVVAADRPAFRAASSAGAVTAETHVFDLTVPNVGEWRHHFERPAKDSWHSRLLK